MADKSHRPNSHDAAGGTGGARRAHDTQGLDAAVPDQPANAKLGYAPPQLIKYGVLADLTAAVGTKGKKDMSGNRRTGF